LEKKLINALFDSLLTTPLDTDCCIKDHLTLPINYSETFSQKKNLSTVRAKNGRVFLKTKVEWSCKSVFATNFGSKKQRLFSQKIISDSLNRIELKHSSKLTM